jgi:signal transduction histidine kinase
MSTKNLFEEIRPTWLARVSTRLAAGEVIQESFAEQLAQLYDVLVEAIADGSPRQVESVLLNWINSRTESDFDPSENSVYSILSQMLLITCDIANETLNDSDALALISRAIPVYTRALEFSATSEAKLELKHLDEELEKTRTNIEKLDDSKSDFISIAAHELRTPLTLIEGYASMLDDVTVNNPQSEQTTVCLNGIKAGTTRLREIVDDMIDVSLIDNGLLTLNYQPVWLNRLLNQVYREVNATVLERNLTLEILPYPGSDEMIFADGERLFQAFRNLVTNAIKYTPDDGRITIDGRLLPGFIETIITDTGIGIDPEDHMRIFEKFGRLGNASLHSSGKLKFKGGGPGLGLPITKGIIEAHNGSIWVESSMFDEKQCPGSAFHVLIPVLKTPPDENTAQLFNHLFVNS